MKTVKRVGLVAAFLVGATLLASKPAAAEKVKGEDWGTIELRNVGDEPQASGQASLKNVAFTSPSVYLIPLNYEGELTVTCQGLTPRTTYWTPAGTFKTDRNGAGQVKGPVEFDFWWYPDGGYLYGNETWWWTPQVTWFGPYPSGFTLDVVRLNPDGSETVVLSGVFLYAGPDFNLD